MPTIVKVLSTGSEKGSCVYIATEGASVLIDAGPPKSKIEKLLLADNFDPTRIDALFVSHEHKDHVGGIGFADKFRIPVYAGEGTLKAIDRLDSGKIIKAGRSVILDALRPSFMTITAFQISHDAMEPLGYTVQTADRKISVLMDTGSVTDTMIEAMAMSDVYIFEANHDLDMLERSDKYHDGLKQRIRSDLGHLSNDAAAAALARLVRGQGEQIYLTHLSSNNNTPALAEKAVKLALFDKGFVKGKHYKLEVL